MGTVIKNTELRNRIANMLFYVALTIELVLMIVEKSEISFSYESYVFRLTFVLALTAVVITPHNLKQWVFILVMTAFTYYCYSISGKNDLLRYFILMVAASSADLKKTMKYMFFITLAGFVTIALLSIAGVMGDMSLTQDFGRYKVETRYALGFGHPNSLFSSAYALLLMWLWIYGGSAGIVMYALVTALSVSVSFISGSRTGTIILILTFGMAYLVRIIKNLGRSVVPYILSALGLAASVGVSVFAANLAAALYLKIRITDPDIRRYFWRLDKKISMRISNLYYGADDHGAIIDNWKLIAGEGADSYFDMGWVRLFYWYGIIPTAILIIMIFAVIYICYRRKDIWSAIIITSLSVYTIIEATFVTRYIGRNFIVPILGVYLMLMLAGNKEKLREAER